MIALAINIKNHFQRILNQQASGGGVVQISLPIEMPFHMQSVRYPTDEKVSYITCRDYINETLKSKSVHLNKALPKRKRKRTLSPPGHVRDYDGPTRVPAYDDQPRIISEGPSQRSSLSSSPNFDGDSSRNSSETSTCDCELLSFDGFGHQIFCSQAEWNTVAFGTDFSDVVLLSDDNAATCGSDFPFYRGYAQDQRGDGSRGTLLASRYRESWSSNQRSPDGDIDSDSESSAAGNILNEPSGCRPAHGSFFFSSSGGASPCRWLSTILDETDGDAAAPPSGGNRRGSQHQERHIFERSIVGGRGTSDAPAHIARVGSESTAVADSSVKAGFSWKTNRGAIASEAAAAAAATITIDSAAQETEDSDENAQDMELLLSGLLAVIAD